MGEMKTLKPHSEISSVGEILNRYKYLFNLFAIWENLKNENLILLLSIFAEN